MNKRHYEHTLPNIRGSLSNTYEKARTNPFDYNELKPMDRQLKDLLV